MDADLTMRFENVIILVGCSGWSLACFEGTSSPVTHEELLARGTPMRPPMQACSYVHPRRAAYWQPEAIACVECFVLS
jgi:hypothetical protein